MRAEVQKIFILYEELVEAGNNATLMFSSNGGKSTIKLQLESPSPSPLTATTRTTPHKNFENSRLGDTTRKSEEVQTGDTGHVGDKVQHEHECGDGGQGGLEQHNVERGPAHHESGTEAEPRRR